MPPTVFAPQSRQTAPNDAAFRRGLAAACFVFLLATASASAEQLVDRAALEIFVARHMGELLQQGELTGGAVVVVQNGEILLCQGYGQESPESSAPIDPERSVFRYGSLSKILVTIAALQLAETHRLNLDADLQPILADVKLPTHPAGPITPRDCLLHTEGFDAGWLIGAVSDRYVSPPEAQAALARTLPPRIAAPGQVYLYGDVGFALLGQAIERTTGKPFPLHMRSAVLEPLGMTHTTFEPRLPNDLLKNLTPGYRLRQGRLVRQPLFYPAHPATAGLSGTPRDLARLMIGLLEPDQAEQRLRLSSAAARSMLQRQFSYDPSMPGATLGWYERCENGHHAIEHGGVMPGYSSHILLIPKLRFGILITCNQYGIDKFKNLLHALLNEFLRNGETPPYADAAPRRAHPGGSRRDFAGRYRYMAYSHSSLVKLGVLGGLWREMSIYATDDGALSFDAQGVIRWDEVAPDLYRRYEDTLRIFRDETGRPTRLGLGYWAFERIAWYEDVRLHRLLIAALTVGFAAVATTFIASPNYRHAPNAAQRRLRAMLAAAAAVNVVFVAGFLLSMWCYDPLDWCFGVPNVVCGLLLLPILSTLLGGVGLGVWAWNAMQRRKNGASATEPARDFPPPSTFRLSSWPWSQLSDLAVLLALNGFGLMAHYWNVWGWRF